MAKPKKPTLSAVECARRTGLTVRALRVYERHGLIEPARSGKGWRLYSAKELQRLNIIVTLKTYGMTLAQIQSLLKKKPPPLARVLEMQLRACRGRRDDAERALQLVQAALTSIESGRPLTLEELCNLTRSMEMENPLALFQIAREAMNENLTPEEERAVMTWVASRPQAELRAMHECAPAILDVHRHFQELRQKDVDPAAPEAQALVARLNELVVRSGARNHRATLFEWNSLIALKWMQFSERLMSKRVISSPSVPPDDGLAAYVHAAQVASPWHRGLEPIVDEAAVLVDKKTQPSSAPAQALVGRLRQVCTDHSVGDPLVYLRWARAMQLRWPTRDDERRQAGWTFLVSAVQAAELG
jgi:DNA-binding transcriptional MerR regulator